MAKANWARLFERDDYGALVEALEKRGVDDPSIAQSWEFFVGALSFSGKMVEARALLDLFKRRRDTRPEQKVAAYFFWGVGLVRHSRYEEARQVFARSYRRLRRFSDARSRFYIFQGVAFFRYFGGRYRRSVRLAERAYAEAFKAAYAYGKLLSLDLLGYGRCQVGLVRQGLADLEQAKKVAETFGNADGAQAHSILSFRASYGLDPQTIEAKLRRALGDLASQNIYSRSALRLELARQLLLRGRGTEARTILDESSAEIYRYANLRQNALLHLRYAHLMLSEGQGRQALIFIRTARNVLNPQVDGLYIRQLGGLEAQVERSLGLASPASQSRARHPEDLIGLRIERRRAGGATEVFAAEKKGEDPLGDLLDLARENLEAALKIVAENSYWGLLPGMLKLPPGSQGLVFDIYGKSLCVISGPDVEYRKLSGQGLWQKLALALSEGFQSKEVLVKKVWGLEYHPLRHDPLLYSAIAKLRKFLGSFGTWIEWNEAGYRLRPGVGVWSKAHFWGENEIVAPLESAAPLTERPAWVEDYSNLNHRQIQLLSHLRRKNFVGVSDYAKLFSVSQITACRDLAGLVKLKRIQKTGRARATRYHLPRRG